MKYEVVKIDTQELSLIEVHDETGEVSVLRGAIELRSAVERAFARGVWKNSSKFSDGAWRTGLERVPPGTFSYRCLLNGMLKVFGFVINWDSARK